MSIDTSSLLLLVQKQEQDRKNFAASVYKAWHSLMDAEKILLTPYDGNYNIASEKVKRMIKSGRKSYWEEWGSKGRLITLMKETHELERKSLMARYQILDGIKQSQQRKKGKDQQKEP